jgi:altronate hydrolase
MDKFTRIDERDNVVVALQPLSAGDVLQVENGRYHGEIKVLEDVTPGHKVAITNIPEGTDIIKYGFPIGHATEDIKAGSWVHTHNVKTNLSGELEYTYQPDKAGVARTYPSSELNWQGYTREVDGKEITAPGVRNNLYIVPTVGCINELCDQFVADFKLKHPRNADGKYGNFDEIIIVKHPYGCSQLGGDLASTRNILLDVVTHPNAGGVLVFGLGCENLTIDNFLGALKENYRYDKSRIRVMLGQQVDDENASAAKLLEELNDRAASDQRTSQPLNKLQIGLKCGGSDGFSGITANPLLGLFSDWLISQGGSTILTEVPEMFGAETILMNRAKDQATFESVVKLINNFKEYFIGYGEPVYENPSPGNKAGGITTLEDKSLGCTQKSGTSPVVDVLQYGEKLRDQGLSLLQSPGNDLVASSALASAGCQIVLFTTGRGTPFGTYVPTLKIASNPTIYQKKTNWLDFNAGRLIEGASFDELLKDFTKLILDTASCKRTRNEINGTSAIAIFKNGVTL